MAKGSSSTYPITAKPGKRAHSDVDAPEAEAVAATTAAVQPLRAGGKVHAPLPLAPTDPSSLDFDNLGFGLIATAGHIRYTWRRDAGGWDDGAWVAGHDLPLSILATALHYGQACFEGLKAYRHARDGKVRVFRPRENWARMVRSAERALMAAPTEAIFLGAIEACIERNAAYVPPAGARGSLYVRPFLFGSGPQLGLQEATEFTFIVTCSPVGEYYSGGGKPVKALVCDDFDRAAPRGVGSYKLAGNYAPTLLPARDAKAKGYPITLYLDPATRTHVDEFATSNFLAVTQTRVITPESTSVLNSVTRRSLMDLAADAGLTPVTRPIAYAEIADGTVEGETIVAVGAVGTAVVVTPVYRIDRKVSGKTETVIVDAWKAGVDADGEVKDGADPAADPLADLAQRLRDIQRGNVEDPRGWMWPAAGIAAVVPESSSKRARVG
ncbi:hypothetical protein H9P43_001708 [Blastocladiella emersonii ATCC 22665]|nr:hypothetical protein H9P43_001708 [Blastocladiella emersonii ATCC 22665]